MKQRNSYRKYKELRRNFYANTNVPKIGTRDAMMITASMSAMDGTEDYLHFRALNEDVDSPEKESFFERVKKTRELALVNARASALWPKKKRFDFRDLLAQLVV